LVVERRRSDVACGEMATSQAGKHLCFLRSSCDGRLAKAIDRSELCW
jgi:hypothetical protein